ncbi:MAG: phosphoribosylamine--glycine ligase, partial [Mucispirillum sp.]|nr:phosphoribosylamine--glycine ligase [Mucispirillum sp.]
SLEEAENALKEMFIDKTFGNAGARVIVEDFMEGEEATYLAVTDGKNILPLSVSQDHKRVYDGDKGANTGGMGAYSPAPVVDKAKFKTITDTIAKPMIDELKKRGITYKGVIYAGLMINNDSIKVVEYNCRFGDPECQVVLSKIKSGLLDAMIAAANGNIENVKIEVEDKTAVCVILISGGYPKEYKSGYEINGIDNAEAVKGVKVFHAGTKLKDNKIFTSGGRVLCVTALDNDLKSAIERAYKGVSAISFHDMAYRKDIGAKGLKHK